MPQILDGREINPNTISWWSKQRHEVKTAAFASGYVPSSATRKIEEWFMNKGTFTSEIHVWANGLLFDVNILNDFMCQYGDRDINDFIKFNRYHDFRTLRNAAKTINHSYLAKEESKYTNTNIHNALSDCYWQIESLKIVTNILSKSRL